MCCEPASMASRRSRSRSRKKARKPKYLSLRRQLAPPPPSTPPTQRPQPLDPCPPLNDHEHVACLLGDDDGAANGLAALLGPATPSAEEAPPSPPRSAAWEGDGEGLARRALRGRERWVFCRSSSSSASASSASEQEASSGLDLLCCEAPRALSLKLDYDEILSAWSDRGSLYINGDRPQVVPEIFVDVRCTGNPCLWTVPDLGEGMKTSDQMEGKREGNREARVMRYKEKRRSRLFSKRIRYEVRKLNAEKRPRVKGRFVKRIDDA